MTELKPCPFCGGEAEIQEEHRWITGVNKGFHWKYVSCRKCNNRTAGYEWDEEKEMVKAWNRRANDGN